MRHTSASVMTDNRKPVKAQVPHRLNLISRHHSLRVREVLGVARRFTAVAKTAKIRADHCESLGKNWSYEMPAYVTLRRAMQQQDWIAVAALNEIDCGVLCFDLLRSEPIRHQNIHNSVSGAPQTELDDCGDDDSGSSPLKAA